MFAGHRIERKASGNLSHALGALGDNDELHQNDDQEDDNTDDHVALNNKFTEHLNDLTCLSALREDQTGGRYIQTQAEQRCNQQQGWENRKLQRLMDIHGDQQNDQRQRDVDDKEYVQQERRQWDQ